MEAETGLATGFRQNGSLGVALSAQRLEEFKRLADMGSAISVEANILTPDECAEYAPHLNIAGVWGGIFTADDGQADPTNIAMALAKGARQYGAVLKENTKVDKILTDGKRVLGVASEQGTVKAPLVVNCAGMWAREVGLGVGVDVPLMACEHFYIVSEPIAGLPSNLPVLRVPDEWAYYKEDAGKILLGAFEPNAKAWGASGIAEDFCFDQLPEDMEHFTPVLEAALNRVPLMQTTGIDTFFNGPESFTPDNHFILGEAPQLRGFYVAAGMNSQGIQYAGGVGKVLAQWIMDGAPPSDLTAVDIRRFYSFQKNRRYLQARVSETLGLLYADHFPYRQFESARGIRRTPLYQPLKERGACFGEFSGWERANWFLPKEAAKRGDVAEYQYGWQRQKWWEHVAYEHLAVREHVGVLDLSTFGKLRVEGADAADFLQKMCANDIDVPIGKIVYTQMLNDSGGVESDATVTRLADDVFCFITGAAQAVRDMAWMKRHLPDNARCVITDISVGEACIGVMGPKARSLLRLLSPNALENDAFSFGECQQIEIGMATARAHRISYVGELGWELHLPVDVAWHVLEAILAADESIRLCGMHAMDSCRLEKGFRHYGHDLSSEDHVLEAGLGFAVKCEKTAGKFGAFIGKDAVLRKRESGRTRRLMQFVLSDPEALLYHHEPILRNGENVGYLTSANYGHYLGAAIGLGYVNCRADETAADLTADAYQIVVAGHKAAAKASFQPPYDPAGARMKV